MALTDPPERASQAAAGVLNAAPAAAIRLPARLTMAEASATLAALRPQLAAAAQPVIDASALVDLDTAALAVLLDCQRQAAVRGRSLQLQGVPPKLGQLARLYGVAGLLAL